MESSTEEERKVNKEQTDSEIKENGGPVERAGDDDKETKETSEETGGGDKNGESGEETVDGGKKAGETTEQTGGGDEKSGESAEQTDKKEQEIFVIQDTSFTVEIAPPGMEPFELPVRGGFLFSIFTCILWSSDSGC